MWALSLQHPTLCLSIILQSGYFFSILPYHNIGGWFFSILCLICGKFFSIILDGMAHVIFKLSWLFFLFFNQIIKSGQFFPVSQLTSEKASSFLEFIRGHFFSILSDSIISPIPIFFVGSTHCCPSGYIEQFFPFPQLLCGRFFSTIHFNGGQFFPILDFV